MKRNKKQKDENLTESKKKHKRKITPIIIAAVVVLFIIVRVIGHMMSSSMAPLVTTTQALRGDIQESVTTSGTVLSEDVLVVFAPANGILADVNVEAGDAVQAGEQLITYNMDQQERTLRSAALQLERSNAGYDGAMADNTVNNAKLNEANINLDVLNQQIADNEAYLKNLQNTFNQNQRTTANALMEEAFNLQQSLNDPELSDEERSEINSQLARNNYLQQVVNSSDYAAQVQQEISDVQERLAGYKEYKAQMESQKSSSEVAVLDAYDRKQLDTDKELANLSYLEIEEQYYIAKAGVTAEFAGIVTSCTAISGEGVAQGTQLLTLESSENLKVSFEASQYDLEKLKLGQQADVVISGNTYHGKISKINRMAERNASNTPMVGVEIHLLDADDNIILGMDARLTIYTQKVQNALLIPVEVINADKEGDFLYCVEDGIIVKKPIVCGISSDTYTEVLEGITEEDVIVLSAFGDLEEGMSVITAPAGMELSTGTDSSESALSITIG